MEESIENKTYEVNVDYLQTIEQAVLAGGYSHPETEQDIAIFFNPPESEAKKFIDSTQQKNKILTQITLVHLGHDVTTEEALKELDQKGFRPVNFYELLALGAQHQDLGAQCQDFQLAYLIVGLGSSWVYPPSDRSVPYLYRCGSERFLSLYWTDRGWGGSWLFAAVSKNKI